MPGINQRMSLRSRALVAPAILLGLLAGGWASIGSSAAAPAEAATGGSGNSSGYFLSSPSAKGLQTAAGAEPDVNCPPAEIRRGASTLTIGPPGALTLKYQGTFARIARECAVVDGNVVMKIGVEGRLIVGPAGGPGQVDVPLRFAVVMETPSGARAVATKFVIVPVQVGARVGNMPFTHVEEAITFPVPTPAANLDDYVVYVGFDPVTAEAQGKQSKPKPKPKPKSKPPAAGAN
jgi:hypothetical protein